MKNDIKLKFYFSAIKDANRLIEMGSELTSCCQRQVPRYTYSISEVSQSTRHISCFIFRQLNLKGFFHLVQSCCMRVRTSFRQKSAANQLQCSINVGQEIFVGVSIWVSEFRSKPFTWILRSSRPTPCGKLGNLIIVGEGPIHKRHVSVLSHE